jgi:hypothetical protein
MNYVRINCHMSKKSVSFSETLWLNEDETLDTPHVHNSQYRTEDSTAAGDDDPDLTTPLPNYDPRWNENKSSGLNFEEFTPQRQNNLTFYVSKWSGTVNWVISYNRVHKLH